MTGREALCHKIDELLTTIDEQADAMDRLTAQNAKLRAALQAVEWGPFDERCPCCCVWKPDHRYSCQLAAALTEDA
jgi:hypothetical protein